MLLDRRELRTHAICALVGLGHHFIDIWVIHALFVHRRLPDYFRTSCSQKSILNDEGTPAPS
jgi:hypothetical protein